MLLIKTCFGNNPCSEAEKDALLGCRYVFFTSRQNLHEDRVAHIAGFKIFEGSLGEKKFKAEHKHAEMILDK